MDARKHRRNKYIWINRWNTYLTPRCAHHPPPPDRVPTGSSLHCAFLPTVGDQIHNVPPPPTLGVSDPQCAPLLPPRGINRFTKGAMTLLYFKGTTSQSGVLGELVVVFEDNGNNPWNPLYCSLKKKRRLPAEGHSEGSVWNSKSLHIWIFAQTCFSPFFPFGYICSRKIAEFSVQISSGLCTGKKSASDWLVSLLSTKKKLSITYTTKFRIFRM
jgi:hypothetical protein